MKNELERLRRICLSIDGAVEKTSHGEPTWFAGEKGRVFAMFDNRHHGALHVSVWLPAPVGAQGGLVKSDPARYFVPPYVGVKGWIGVVLDTKPDWKVVESLVNEAFVLVAKPTRRGTEGAARPSRAAKPAPSRRRR